MAKRKEKLIKAGQPTKYNEHTIAQVRQYLLDCEDNYVEVPILDVDGEYIRDNDGKIKTRQKHTVKLPNVAGLAVYLGVSRETLYEWGRVHKEFSDILKEVLAKQEEKLIQGGISGEYNGTIAKLILTKHGYSDKIDTDLTSKGERIGLPTDRVSEIKQALKDILK